MLTVCWYCDVRPLSDPELFAAGLSGLPWEERREKVSRFLFEKDRRLCLGAGMLLAHALREAGAADLRLSTMPEGKPVLADRPDIHFNLSHSGTLAVCAVSGLPVGANGGFPRGKRVFPGRGALSEGESKCVFYIWPIFIWASR